MKRATGRVKEEKRKKYEANEVQMSLRHMAKRISCTEARLKLSVDII
jgi:hypothetical protein